MHALNLELAKIFEEMGSIYEFLGEKNRFRAIAYHTAARTLEDFPEDVQDFIHSNSLNKIPGVGKTMEAKIKEYYASGKIKKYESLRKRIPHDFIELLHVQGFGPETLKKFYNELKLKKKEDVLKALEDGRALSLKGFKEKKVANLREALMQENQSEKRALLWDALELSDMVVSKLSELPEVMKIDVAGSVRRKKETIGDIDILIAARDKERKKIIRRFVEMDEVSKVYAEGDTKASIYMEHFNRQIDIRIVKEEEWGAALQYFTGSKAHNIHLRKIAIGKGFKLNEYGVVDSKTDKKLAGNTEEEIYKVLGMQWMPPEMRKDTGEIELAIAHDIPILIKLEDIKGDMHFHSNWSDGLNSLEEIADYVSTRLKYEYLVITDHSKSQIIAGGMKEDEFFLQMKAIKEVNKKLGRSLLKAGAEVDILSDGSLDLSNDLLQQLDWVVASVHSQFKKDNTKRIIKACENPYVHVIGHPTGRLVGVREPYPLNMDEVMEAAAATGTALEINAHANRMDLNDLWVRRAKEKGVTLVISTDSHNTGNYHYMKLGIAIAQRAWCQTRDILNTRSWSQIEEFKKKKLKGSSVLKQ